MVFRHSSSRLLRRSMPCIVMADAILPDSGLRCLSVRFGDREGPQKDAPDGNVVALQGHLETWTLATRSGTRRICLTDRMGSGCSEFPTLTALPCSVF
ncbi:hypothetical protein RHIZ404_200708 [Rhizobium sp. EC-SD404]|nr:hypothetical protein RHIZ404_200708 [Rhizobium sp. EC-SD404]